MGKSLQQLIVTNYGLSPSGYTGSRGNIGYAGSAGSGATVPKITAITYPGDDTAADVAGGQTITITGTGFASGASVIINGIVASVVSVVNSTTITFTAPAVTAGSYILYVVNTDGSTALAVPGIQYSGTPVWTTAAGTLGTIIKQTSFTANLSATGDAPVTYSVSSGALPAGLTLTANTGVLSGTAPNVASSTTYNFTVRSTDAQRQDTDRAFSITVLPINPPPAVDYLVVAGGGGAGGLGGGGAGGMLTGTGFSVTSSTLYTITVGAGGIGRAQGTGSVFSSITTVGGGTGPVGTAGTHAESGGGPGGSGGGGAYGSPYQQGSAGGAGTAGQGNNGGTGAVWVGGGGGGRAAAGYSGTGQTTGAIAGAGGSGLSSSITGSAVVYAGGGGGGAYGGSSGTNGANGGSGGGGHGLFAYSGNGGNGTTNTGGGGGGYYDQGTSSGGSGIVVIRFPDSYSTAQATTGSPTYTQTGGYHIYKFTTSGSVTF
jgi:hypothetical protein